MGRRRVPNKKLPKDYPQIAFRIAESDKKQIVKTIEELQEELNRRRDKNEPYVNKNDIVIQALKIGLKVLKKN